MNNEEKQVDFLSIGDIAVDNLIKISDVEEKCDTSGHCQLCFRFADKIPYEFTETCYATGNSSNVAVSASKFGLSSYLVSYLGNDNNGLECLNSLKKDGVGTDYIKAVDNLPTNYHYVLWHNTERTILTNHADFPYSLPKELPIPKWLYLSSLASNSLNYYSEILEFLNSHSEIKLAFQPGTFQIKLGADKLKDIYKRSDVFLCNKEEAEKILGIKETGHLELMKTLKALGPKIVVLTDGENGSYSFDGTNAWHMKILPQVPYERTGAGDAYSSAFICALFYGKNIEEAMIWGSINAMSVVTKTGPQKGLLTKEEIEEKIREVGEDYKPIKIN